MQIPDFITHYHLADRRPFLNLSDLNAEDLSAVMKDLVRGQRAGQSERRFGTVYMELRKETETLLRDRFRAAGGRPERSSPHYFVLGQSPWFRGLYADPGEVRVQLADIPTDQVSFTYPDSVTSMGALGQYGITVDPQPYHGRVFRIEDLTEVAERFGIPGGTAPTTYQDHQRDPSFEHYIEVQVWSDLELSPTQRRVSTEPLSAE